MPHRGEVRAWRRPLYDITARRFLDPGHPLLADGEFKPMVGRASAVSSIATNRHAARRSSPDEAALAESPSSPSGRRDW